MDTKFCDFQKVAFNLKYNIFGVLIRAISRSITVTYCSLRDRRSKGREWGKTSAPRAGESSNVLCSIYVFIFAYILFLCILC